MCEGSVVQESHSEPENKAEDSPLLTEEDTSSGETQQLKLKTTTQPHVSIHARGLIYVYSGERLREKLYLYKINGKYM